jgi:drug/metabolite transporter (DMT)-like permease
MNKNTKLILLVISALILIIIFREEIKLVLTIIGIFVVAGLILQWLEKNKK